VGSRKDCPHNLLGEKSKMIHPDTALKFISDGVGFGVVATKLIPKGTIAWVGDDLDFRISAARYKKMDALYKRLWNRYAYRDEKGNYVLDWDIGRYVNHSFNPNCVSTAYDFDLAVRDIQPGEEITEDYGFLNLTEEDIFAPVPEPGATRVEVRPEDFLKNYRQWDEQIADTFKHFATVDQPLQKYIRREYRRVVEKIISGKRAPDSILNTSVHRDKDIKHLTTLRDSRRKPLAKQKPRRARRK